MSNLQEAGLEVVDPKLMRMRIVNTYVLRAVNLCVDRGILPRELRARFNITERGHIQSGGLDVTEAELREAFANLTNGDYLNESLEYDDVFNGVISKGEVIH